MFASAYEEERYLTNKGGFKSRVKGSEAIVTVDVDEKAYVLDRNERSSVSKLSTERTCKGEFEA